MSNFEAKWGFEPSPDYIAAFNKRVNTVATRLEKTDSGLSIVHLEDELGSFLLTGSYEVESKAINAVGNNVIGDTTMYTSVPVQIHFGAAEIPSIESQWVNFRSVILPDILTGDADVDSQILQYVLMVNHIANFGTFAMADGGNDLLWKTSCDFKDFSGQQLEKEVINHAISRYNYLPHFDLSFIPLRHGMSAEELFLTQTQN